ncbi:MAG TPA: glycoside hydrolase family 9 protein [Prolixibacteraceae bacterium]|nr:glycoside hydrolase family 9 protein [Prolixibacteraceae bacterium]
MKTIFLFYLAAFTFISTSGISQDQLVHLNSLGFLPESSKKASIIGESKSFVIRRVSDQTIVFTRKVSKPVFQKDVNQTVSIADFSSFSKSGKYYLEIPEGAKSIEFEISPTVYNQAFYTSMRAFYLWRCGTAVSGDYNGHHFEHDICHLEDGYEDYQGKPGERRDGTKGWHDAGDYGKYVVNAGITVGMMFMAWDQFQDNLKNFKLDLPETAAGYPDFLKEMKWETDWLLTMQYTDGSGKVAHKLTRKNFAPFIKPEDDQEKRYFTEWSSAATADFVAMMAQAARYFEPYDKAYSQKCLEAAQLSYKFLKENPKDIGFVQGEFKTGGYQTTDKDDRLWAAVEMWETTGNPEFLKDFESRAEALSFRVDEVWDWGNVANLGMFEYVLSKKSGKDPKILKTIRKNCVDIANDIVIKAAADVYGRPLDRYFWGCNGTVARQVLNLQIANKIAPDKIYTQTSQDAIAHIFGRNYYNRSYVTGLGINPAMNPHDRRSASDNEINPWPGYLVGGGHSATEWNDKQEDFRTNEIAINWQAALVYALAGFINN